MISRLPDVAIDTQEPFKNDKLNRLGCANNLTALISRLGTGCVLAINGEWGCGKTTFIKMWQQHLANDGFQTLYFNAWESDFTDDPITALLGELKAQVPAEKRKESFKTIVATGGKILQATAMGALKAVVGQKFVEVASEAISSATDAVGDIFDKKLDEYGEQKKDIGQFKAALESLAKQINPDKPLVFFVDELDRCAPTYSVKVLERIKHLFSVPGIVFVLSIDKTQLANAIRGYYGSDLINAEEYLKRFIDIEYGLPEPDAGNFCDYMFQALEIGKAISYGSAHLSRERVGTEGFLRMAKTLCESKHLSLRQMEKLFVQSELAFTTQGNNTNDFASMIFMLTYLRSFENEVYSKICRREYDINGLVKALYEKLPKEMCSSPGDYEEEKERTTLFTIADILMLYGNNFDRLTGKGLMINNGKEKKLTFDVAGFNEENMLDAIDATLHCEMSHWSVDLSWIIRRVEFAALTV